MVLGRALRGASVPDIQPHGPDKPTLSFMSIISVELRDSFPISKEVHVEQTRFCELYDPCELFSTPILFCSKETGLMNKERER